MKSLKFALAVVVTGIDKETFKLKDVQKTFEELQLLDDIKYRTKQNILAYMVKCDILHKFSKMRYVLNDYIKLRVLGGGNVIKDFINVDKNE